MRTALLLTILTIPLGCQKFASTGPSGASTGTAEKKVYDRDEFKKLVMGKTEAEVIAAVGKPSKTGESQTSKAWYYEERTRDTVTGKLDRGAQLMIRNDIVDSIDFY